MHVFLTVDQTETSSVRFEVLVAVKMKGDCGLLGCCTVYFSTWVPVFQSNPLHWAWGQEVPLKCFLPTAKLH